MLILNAPAKTVFLRIDRGIDRVFLRVSVDFFKCAANLGFSRIGKYLAIELVRAQANSIRYKRAVLIEQRLLDFSVRWGAS